MDDLPDPLLPPSNPWTVAVGVAGLVLALGGAVVLVFFAEIGGIGVAMLATAIGCWLAAIVIEGVGWHVRHPR